MTVLPNTALPLLALATGCFGGDKRVTEGPEARTPASPALEHTPDPAPDAPVEPAKPSFRPGYIGNVRCWEEDGSETPRASFGELFDLRGTTFWYPPKGEKPIPADFYVVRKDGELDVHKPLHLGDWIEDRWQIIYGKFHSVTVLNECNIEETIPLWEGGFVEYKERKPEPEEEPWEEGSDIPEWEAGDPEFEHGERVADMMTDNGRQLVFHDDGTFVLYSEDPTATPTMKYIYDPALQGWVLHRLGPDGEYRAGMPPTVHTLEDLERGLKFDFPESSNEDLNEILDDLDGEGP